jgi:hypothetical protein
MKVARHKRKPCEGDLARPYTCAIAGFTARRRVPGELVHRAEREGIRAVGYRGEVYEGGRARPRSSSTEKLTARRRVPGGLVHTGEKTEKGKIRG